MTHEKFRSLLFLLAAFVCLPIIMFTLDLMTDYERIQDIKALYAIKFVNDRIEKIIVKDRNTNQEHLIFKTISSSDYFPVYLQPNYKLDSLFAEDEIISKSENTYDFSLMRNNKIYNLRFQSLRELIKNWIFISFLFELIIIALLLVQLFRTESILKK